MKAIIAITVPMIGLASFAAAANERCQTGGEETARAIGYPAHRDNPDCGAFNGKTTTPLGSAFCVRPCVNIPPNVKVKRATILHPAPYGYELWHTIEVYPKPGIQTVCLNYKNWSENWERKVKIQACWDE
jgi:hypothetical protein